MDIVKELTIAQIVGAVGWAFAIVVLMAKHFKTINDSWPSVVKAWKYVQKKAFARAIFRMDVLSSLKEIKQGQTKIDERLQLVEYETKDNSGGSLKDVAKRTEAKLDVVSARLDFTELKLEAGYQLGGRMTAVLNRNAECIEVNPVFLKFFGWSKEEILQAGYENIVHEDDRREMQVKLSRAIETGSKFNEPDIRIFDSDSKEYHVTMNGYPNVNRATKLVENYFITFEILNK